MGRASFFFVVALVLVVVAIGLEAAQAVGLDTQSSLQFGMTDAEVEEAIRLGTTEKKNFFVEIGGGLRGLLSRRLITQAVRSSRLSPIWIWTPSRNIAHEASLAAAVLKPFRYEDVSAEMRREWVVFSPPPEPNYFNTTSAGSTANIVIKTPDNSLVLQPLRTEVAGGFNIGSRQTSQQRDLDGLKVYFLDTEVRKVAGPMLDQEFEIGVAFSGATVWNTEYSVKKGDLEKLRGLR